MSDASSVPAHAGMPCPHCRVDLVMSDRQGIEIDYCPKCRGVWLDRGELDKLIERNAQYTAAPQAEPPPTAPPVQSSWTLPNAPPSGVAPPAPPGWGQGYAPSYQGGGHGGDHGNQGSGHSGGGHGNGGGHGGRGGHNSFLGRIFG